METKLVKVAPATRVLGAAGGLVQEIDPDWWKPMTDDEVAEFFGED